MKGMYWAMLAMGCAAMMGAGAQILFKKANTQFDASVLTNWLLIAGLMLYGVAFIINIIAYRYGPASVLYPVVALSNVFLIIFASFFLGEALSWNKMLGACVVIVGIILIWL